MHNGSTTVSERTRYMRSNYLVHAIEGGLFVGGLAFVDANTILPAVIKDMGGPQWLITLMPCLMPIGFLLPPLFTTPWIERLRRYKLACMATGIFQRLAYLLAAILLLSSVGETPKLAIAVVALVPLLSGIFGGITLTAWQQLLMRTIPEHRRASLFAMRYLIACGIGLGAGWVVKWMLTNHPGAEGYGMLHLFAFALLTISFISFTLIRETGDDPIVPPQRTRLITSLRSLPELIRADQRLRLFLAKRFFANAAFILIPWLSIYARETLQQPDSYLGELQMAFMFGALLGNIIAAYIGDRFGCKVTLLIMRFLFISMALWALFAETTWEFQAVFTLFGLSFYGGGVGTGVLGIEICPAEKRTAYLSMLAFINLPSLLLASALSALLWKGTESFGLLVGIVTVCLLISYACLLAIRDPRHEKTVTVRP